jgi:class 3 adenylate cyclase/tetratricopeptide (TPR) repeat protein
MKCATCQFENPPGMKFCGECGERLQNVCPACKAVNPPNHKFCGECGQRLTTAAPPEPKPAAQALSPAPESYTPKHLAERILSSREALEGERKRVTVLFADLKGSTELIQGLDPEDTRLLLDRALHAMMDAVHAYEGTVNQIMGDGIMALFGAPVAHEDHAVRACYAALAMQEGIRRYGEETLRERGVPVRIRVGLNSGEVVVRTIANDLRMDYSAIGPTTHLAARMEQNAPDGTTLLTPETFRLTEGYVEARSMGRIPVKGVPEPMEVYELIGAGVLRTRFQVSASRGLTRFVGREHELEVLSKALERSAAGQGQLMALVGEAGTGKSRLVWEVVQSSKTDGWLVLQAMSTSYGKTGPYAPVIDLIRRYFGIETDDSADVVREKLTDKLVSLDEALLTTLPVFLTLLDVPVDVSASSAEAEWQSMDPPQRRRRTLDAIAAVLAVYAHCQPVLLVIEDMQSIDAESRAVVDHLVENVPHERMMLLITFRQEQHRPVPVQPGFTQLLIEALSPDSADELLDELIGESSELAPVKQFLIQRTKGNPFFLEELVRTMVETGVLQGQRGAYQLAKPLHSVQIPASVQAVVSARIDRLASEDKRVLQAASVIGMEIPHATLDAILELSGPELEASLDRLQRAQFLYRMRVFPEPEYAFKHGLTREVAYDGLLLQRRRALHGQIVEAIERLYAERLVDKVDRLAQHALAGEVWDKAVHYSRQAAGKAAQTAAYRAAIGALEQALVALDHLPSTPETKREAIDIRLDLRGSLQPLGELRAIHDHMRVAEGLAKELGERERLARTYSYLCSYFATTHQPDAGIESGESAVALAEETGNLGLQVLSTMMLGELLYSLGDFRRCASLMRRAVSLLTGEHRYERFGMTGVPAALARGMLMVCLAELGEFAEAERVAPEAIQLAEEVNLPYTLAWLCSNQGLLHLIKGDLPHASRTLLRAIDVCRTWKISMQAPAAIARLGYTHVLLGELSVGLPLLEDAVQQAESIGRLYEQATIVSWLGLAYLQSGRAQDAIKMAERAFELAESSKQNGKRAHTLRILGDSYTPGTPGQMEQAETCYIRSLELAVDLGMRPLQAHCQLGLGRLHRRAERLDEARFYLNEAIALYAKLNMTFWIPQAEAELQLLTAPEVHTDSGAPLSRVELSGTR